MSKTILITSCKGGVGKSTVAANLSAALAFLGKRVILADMDLGNRSLDLILGCEDDVVYDVEDVCVGDVDLDRALIRLNKGGEILFLPAPFMYSGRIDKANFSRTIEDMKAAYSPDYIILDTSGGAGISVELCSSVADRAIIVSSRNPASVRAAQKSAALLDDWGVGIVQLVINCFELDRRSNQDRAGILSIIDSTGVSLLGIVPRDRDVEILCERSRLPFESKKSISRTAFENIARRIAGERVHLLSSIKGLKERQRRRILSGDSYK